MKKHYLIHETTYFVDPHGSPDMGGTVKYTEITDEFEGLDLSKTYSEDLEEVDQDNYHGSEDGYNAEYRELDIKEITEEEYHTYTKIIKDYDAL